MTSVHPLPFHVFNFSLFFHLRLGLPNGLFFSIFPTNNLPLFPNPATCPAYVIPLHLIPLKITKFHTVRFSPPSCYFLLRSPKFLPQHPIAQHSQPMFFPKYGNMSN